MTALIKLGIEYTCGHNSAVFVDTTILRREIREYGNKYEELEAELLRRVKDDYDFDSMKCTVKGCRRHNKDIKRICIMEYDFCNL